MAIGQLHLAPDGPSLCAAEQGGCPYEADGHYTTASEAESAFEEKMGGAIPPPQLRTIMLSSNLGTAEVMDGDLSDPTARALLSSGLCGDLALAIHRETGGNPYFLSFSFADEESLARAFAENPDAVIHASTHVVVESPSAPGSFLDGHGQRDREDLEDSYGDAWIVRGTPAMLEHFADPQSADRLKNFARSAIELDREGIGYSFDLDEFDWDEEDDSDDEE